MIEIVSGTESESEEVVNTNKRHGGHGTYPIKVRMTQFHKFQVYKIDNPLTSMTTYCNDLINNDSNLKPALSRRTFNSWRKEYAEYIRTEESNKYFPIDNFLLSNYQNQEINEENATETLRIRKSGSGKKRKSTDNVTSLSTVIKTSIVKTRWKKSKKRNLIVNDDSSRTMTKTIIRVSENGEEIILQQESLKPISDWIYLDKKKERMKPGVPWEEIGYITVIVRLIFYFLDPTSSSKLPCNRYYWNVYKELRKIIILNKYYSIKFKFDIKFKETLDPSQSPNHPQHQSTMIPTASYSTKQSDSTVPIYYSGSSHYYCDTKKKFIKRTVKLEENAIFSSFKYNIHGIEDPQTLNLDQCYIIKSKKIPRIHESAQTYVKFTSPNNGETMYIHICDIHVRKVDILRDHTTDKGIFINDLVPALNKVMEINDTHAY